MGKVNFFQEDTPFKVKHRRPLSHWVKTIIEAESEILGELNYIFCSDDYLLQINKQYLQHDYYTDIITFDNKDDQEEISGDIFISIDRVRENAIHHQVSFEQELYRVMIHGVLHLLGYKDKTTSDRSTMRSKEDASISLLKI